jgi:hypothetical protein
MRDAFLIGFFDEMQKMAASKGMAGYMQSRRGTRPYRVSTLLQRDQMPTQPNLVTQNPEMDQPEPAQNVEETEDGDGGAVKMAESAQDKAVDVFVKAKPYLKATAAGAVPGALLGSALGGMGTPAGRHAGRVGAVIGGGLGVANRALSDWAEKHKRTRLAKKILKKD